MKLVIDVDENVFTRLFDNGTEDYGIGNDDVFTIAKSIRNGTPLEEVLGEIKEQNDRLVKVARRISTLYVEEAEDFGRMIEEIKEEIQSLYSEYGDGSGWEESRNITLNEVMRIVDSHISGKEQSE